MDAPLRFDDQVFIVTGGGRGLGAAYSRLLASRGAKVVVNDIGTSLAGNGTDESVAQSLVRQIIDDGGTAVACTESVEQGARIVDLAMSHYGRVDGVINNAGIIRDVSFHKMSEEDWDSVYRVHVLGAYRVTRAAWPIMRERNYGRVVMIGSASGIYGSHGQASYCAAKMALFGLARALAIEGRSRNILVNVLAPAAASRMTDTTASPEISSRLPPEAVSPVAAYLSHSNCTDTGQLWEALAGRVRKYRWERSVGIRVPSLSLTPELVAASYVTIGDFGNSTHPQDAQEAFAADLQQDEA